MDKLQYCLSQINKIKQENNALNADRETAIKFYHGDPDIVKVIENRTSITTSDLMDVIEWAKPALLEIFTSQNEVVTLQPSEESDVPAVKKQNILVNHQLKHKNKWFLIVHDWISDALLLKTGVVKYQWKKETKFIEKRYEGLDDLEFQAKISEPDTEILEHEEIVLQEASVDMMTGIEASQRMAKHNVTVRYAVNDEYPLIEAVPTEEFGLPVRAKCIEDAPFVFHCIKMPKWKAVKIYGEETKEKIEKAYQDIRDSRSLILENRYSDIDARKVFDDDKNPVFYECYYYDEETGEPRLTILCGAEIIKDVRNEYDKPPFHVITPLRMAHRVNGLSMFDLLKKLMQLRTELLRQIVDNLYQSNFRRYFGDPERINMNDFLNNNVTNAFIRTVGDPTTVVMPEQKAPLPPEVFSFWETLQIEKDYHSGVPRAYQGVVPAVQHRTFRGANQQVQLASQRIQYVARLIAEMGISPLVTDVVNMNIKFLTKKASVRYLNEWVEIHPDNIIGKFDVTVNIGIGTNNKDNIVIQMQQLLQLFYQIYAAGIPIVTPQNAYNAVKELVEAMGFKNTSDFVTDPNLSMAIKNTIQMLMPYASQNPQLGQLLMQLAVASGNQAAIQPQGMAKDLKGQVTAEEPANAGVAMPPISAMSGRGFMP